MLNELYHFATPWAKATKRQINVNRMLGVAANALYPIYCAWSPLPKQKTTQGEKMVVSLTTFPLRIGKVHLTIQSILRQSRPADRILLWLSKEEFPEEAQLPANLLRLKEKGLDIRFCDNIRSFKKVFYTAQEFENDVTSLAAEDIINKYGTHLLVDVGIGARFRGLYRTAVPTATSATSTTKITLLSALEKIGQQGLFTGSGAGGWEEDVAQSIGGQLILEFYGGNTSLLTSQPITDGFNAWWNSFNEENYTLTKITQNKVLPIYELIADATKKEQVKDAIEKYISNQKLSLVSTTPLLQAWNGKNHTYDTSYLDIAMHSNKKYEGAICSIYKQQITSTVPLYLYSNGKKQRLSVELLPADTEWQLEKELGYVYASPVEGAIPLYEAENKNDYCYTTEDKQEYGTKGSWKQKGIVCYTMPL